MWGAIREPLAKNGLSVTQTLGNDPVKENILIVETTLLHSSGEWIASKLAIVLSKTDPQAIGSAISYVRRYSLSAILGVSAEDDDAEATTDHKEEKAAGKSVPGEHWCAEHNTAFIRHENAKGEWYSHQRGNGWCSENKGKAKLDTIPVIAPQSPEIKKKIDSIYGEEPSPKVTGEKPPLTPGQKAMQR